MRSMNPIKGSLIWLAAVATAIAVIATLTACKSNASPAERQAPAPTLVATAARVATNSARVEVRSDGFHPPRVVLGTSHQVTFRRTTDSTCATAVVFPDLGIEKTLPLDTDVSIELPPSAKGELTFQCGMGMYKSKVVVQ